jgi:hypothetical protein
VNSLINIPAHLSIEEALDYLNILKNVQTNYLIRKNKPVSKRSVKTIDINNVINSDEIINTINRTIKHYENLK